MTELIMKEKWLMKKFPLMPYCVLAVQFLETNDPECWLPDEFHVLFNVVFLKLVVMTEFHVQLVRNSLIRIQILNLRISSTQHYPVEPLTFLNCMKPHSYGENVEQKTSKHTFQKRIKVFLKRVQIWKFALLMVST